MGSNSEIQGYNFYPMLYFHKKFSNSVTTNKNSHCNKNDLAQLCCEGEVKLFNYLIQFAHSTDNNELLVEYEPDLSKVCKWQYKDIMQIKDTCLCSEFEHACLEELEAL